MVDIPLTQTYIHTVHTFWPYSPISQPYHHFSSIYSWVIWPNMSYSQVINWLIAWLAASVCCFVLCFWGYIIITLLLLLRFFPPYCSVIVVFCFKKWRATKTNSPAQHVWLSSNHLVLSNSNLLRGGALPNINTSTEKGDASRKTSRVYTRLSDQLGTRAHAYLWITIHSMRGGAAVLVKSLVRWIFSLYEWLIKEETAVFSGNGGRW